MVSVQSGHAQPGRGRSSGRGQRAGSAPGPGARPALQTQVGRGEGEGGPGLVTARREVIEHVLLHRGVDPGGDVPLERAVDAAGPGPVTVIASVTLRTQPRAQTPAQILRW